MVLKFFRKPVLSVFFAFLMLVTSCSQNDSEVRTEIEHKKMSETELQNASKLISSIGILNYNKSENSSEDVSPFEVYNDWVENEDINVPLDENLDEIMNASYEENIETLMVTGVISSEEVQIINNFKDELLANVDFDIAVQHFEQSINSLNLTDEKLRGYYNFIDGLSIINYMEPEYFSNDASKGIPPKKGKSIFGTCFSASIGVGIAFAGLATIEVGSFGVATAAAVGGFIWASAEWGKACGK